jgi:ComB9 competence protein
VKSRIILGASLALTISVLAMPAMAQSAPTLDQLPVIGGDDGAPQMQGQNVEQGQGTTQTQAPQLYDNADTGQSLADEARIDGSQQPASPAMQYAAPATTDQRIADQEQGNFGDMDRSGVGMPLGTTQDAWNKPFKNMAQGQTAPGVIHFKWSQDLTMPVRMREYMNTFIVLPGFEKIRDVYLGESFYFEAMKVRENTVAVRVKGSGVDTNLNIVGESGNLYTFYLRAEGYNTTSITDMQVFVDAAPLNPGNVWFKDGAAGGQMNQPQSFNGGAGQQAQPMPQSSGGSAAPAAVEGSNLYIPSLDLKFVHKMYEVHPGDRAIAPEYVATDGRWTYFWYGAKAGMVDRPAVFRLVDGVEEQVNTRTIGAHGETLVAEAVGEFVLRNGQKTVCIKVNADGSVVQK